MADEVIDIYDEYNNPTGEQKLKSEAHQQGNWHRSAHVWIFNSNSEILLQLRSKDKDIWPDTWDVSAAGHVSANEEPIESAVRETKEELGVSFEKGDLEFVAVIKQSSKHKELIDNEFDYIYFVECGDALDDLEIQKEEVQKVKFFTDKEIQNELEEKESKLVSHKYWGLVLDKIQ
ncbi:MAG: NUDIX domain-containing protein [Candidatus Magasanikbacteria bacterium]